MHSALNRVQSVFGFFTTVAFVLASLTALSVVLHPAAPATSVEVSNVQVIKGRPHYYATKREEYAQIKFDLDADFSSLFNWNTKDVFVYVLASYPSSSNNKNLTTESIIWDTIIPAPESPYSIPSLTKRFFPSLSTSTNPKKSKSKSKNNNKNTKNNKPKTTLHLKNQKPKYQITDISGSIASRSDVQLVVGWNVQPWVGALMFGPHTKVAGNIGGTLGGVLDAAVLTGGSGGRSKPFEFPALKGKRREGSGSGSGSEL
ncbi:hypothetical protein FQN53_001345 [Emmonsiellopsis sp. PD_33]|nr:hypothetical protein FQN53_001345 [Emmonsiellopsis sp. PD_33]